MAVLGVFPVICGPTAGGKSALGVAVARALERRTGAGGAKSAAEVVTADAFQVYRGMDIGTAKPTVAERGGIPHHLIDLVEPSERFTVDDWLKAAERVIAEVRARGGVGGGAVPVVVGGTHLYVKALMEGLFEGPEPDAGLRAALEAMDAAARRAELERVDPDAAARIHFNDVRRTVRALEVFRQTGVPISRHQRQWRGTPRGDARLVVLSWPVEELNRRINARVKAMMAAGLLEEVRGLWAAGRLGPQAREALGYRQLIAHLEDPRGVPLEEAVEAIKIQTRRFAKNQRTWLKSLAAGGSGGAGRSGAMVVEGPRAAAEVDAVAEEIAACLHTDQTRP